MSPLSLADQLKLYGYTMQALYGDNKTKQPTIFELEKYILWGAWTDQKGMSKLTAKMLFLKSVEGLW
jgi:acyl-CoA-binding protein